MKLVTSSVVASLLVGVVVGCGSASDGDGLGTTVGEHRVDPEGTEDLGELVIEAPKKATVDLTKFVVMVDGAQVELGAATRLKGGQHNVTVAPVGTTPNTQALATVTQGKKTVFTLAEIGIVLDPKITEVDLQPRPSASITLSGSTFVGVRTSPPGQPVTRALSVPGALHLEYKSGTAPTNLDEFYPPADLALAEGDVKDWVVNMPDPRMTVDYTVEASEFPEVQTSDCVTQYRYSPLALFGSDDGNVFDMAAGHDLSKTTTGVVRFLPVNRWAYSVRLHGRTQAVSATKGGHVSLPINRIDVNHVSVKKDTGGTDIVPGTYQIFAGGSADPSQVVSISAPGARGYCEQKSSFNTLTGLYLPAGKYTVVTSFTTKEGTKTDTDVVSLP